MILVIWLIFGLLMGAVALVRGRSFFIWCILTLLISPLITAILLLLLPNLKEQRDRHKEIIETLKTNAVVEYDNTTPCPYCAEMIKKEAVYCRFCHKDLN